MADITVTLEASGEAYVGLVVGASPEVRDSVDSILAPSLLESARRSN